MRYFAALLIASTPSLAAAQAEEAPSKISQFLQAADENEFSTMLGLMTEKVTKRSGGSISKAKFIEGLSTCYLRRVYVNDNDNSILAAWMCDEGVGKSRVIIADVWTTERGVQIGIAREDRNNVAAPIRSGSAFGEEK